MKKAVFWILALIGLLITINGALAAVLYQNNFETNIQNFTNVAGSGSFAQDSTQANSGTYSMHMNSTSSSNNKEIETAINNSGYVNITYYYKWTGDIAIQYRLRDGATGNLGIIVRHGADGKLYCYTDAGWAEVGTNLNPSDTWYATTIIFNGTEGKQEVYSQGSSRTDCDTGTLGTVTTFISEINMVNTDGASKTGPIWVDDITAIDENGLPLNESFGTITATLKDILTNVSVNEFNVSLYNSTGDLVEINETFTGTATFEVTYTDNYTIVLSYAKDYAYTNVSNATIEVETLGFVDSHVFYAYRENSVYFTFYEELTRGLLTGENISIVINNDNFVYENTTINDSVFFIDNLSAGEYTATFSAANYLERFYIFDITQGSTQSIDLYLINTSNSDPITVNLKTYTGDIVSGAIIKLLRYYSDINAYTTVEMTQSNFDGDGILQIQRATSTDSGEFYKFIIEVDSIVYLETTPSKIAETTLNFVINLQGETIEEYKDSLNLAYDLSFTEASNNFRFTFSQGQGGFIGACLYVYSYSGLSKTLYNSTCLNSTAGTLLINVANTSGASYVAEAYATYAGLNHYLGSEYKKYDAAVTTFGRGGAFLAAFVVLMFAFVGVYSPVIAIILTMAGLTFTMIFGILPLNWGILIGLISGGLILIWINKA